MQKINVDLGERSYDIVFDDLVSLPKHLFDTFKSQIASQKGEINLILVSNTTVGPIYAERLLRAFELESTKVNVKAKVGYVVIQDGEHMKNITTYNTLIEDLLAQGIDRKTVLIALGGGVTTDLVGFAAATVLRGVDFVNVPTTLLAMVDASVGGKTGINTPHGKNLLGAFWQPRLVLAPMDTLKTLSDPEFRCGLGEVVKHTLLDNELCMSGFGDDDASKRMTFMEFMINYGKVIASRNNSELFKNALQGAVRRSCEVKARIVKEDERESDKRALLNLGHTVAHAIEFVQGIDTKTGEEDKLRHGEAVAVGTLAELQLSIQKGTCKDSSLEQKLILMLKNCGLPTGVAGLSIDDLIEASFMDKKRESQFIKVTQPVTEGDVALVKMAPEDLRPAFDKLASNLKL